VTVRIRDVDGAILDDRPVAFVRSTCEDPGDDVTGVVDAVLLAVDGVASIELLVDGHVVDSQPVGGAAAPIGELERVDREAAGPGEAPGGALELRWGAPDAPPGQRYVVQISDDAGATWRTVAVGQVEPALTLPPDKLTGDEITGRSGRDDGDGIG
jgi:hypothetical protein